jgi:bacteriocin-type transport-associated protein
MRKVLFILGQLSDLDIEWLIAAGRKEQIPAGTTLIHEGKAIDALYIVLDGLLSVTMVALGGQEIARLGSGEMAGEMSFVDARPPSATVLALQDSMVLAVPRRQLVAKLEQDAPFAARFYRALATFLSDRLRGTVSRLGYSEGQSLQEDIEYSDELDDNVLDTVHLAGTRFERILKQLMHGK